MSQLHALDWSLANQIPSPTQLFQKFLEHFFTEPQIWIRREYDLTLIDRLEGTEHRIALELIAQNVPTGHEHIITAAGYLHMTSVIPALEKLFAETDDNAARLTIAQTLQSLGALDDGSVFDIMMTIVQDGQWSQIVDVYSIAYRIFPPDTVRRLIEPGLRRLEFGIRFAALDALIAVSHIEANGENFTPVLGEEIAQNALAAMTAGSGVPLRYDEAQYYLGDAVYSDRLLFAGRLRELSDKYRKPAR